ncbi:hypothetical protein LOTGIDRAFT_158502 [Lottia gigantea]|uniref:C3H1-type domain-containing protein n=1 Tax=Lottia gigantea TaxID=225164 RepID=V4CC25_LOTGI|nr:hypothetical protein LOTGIDRAFT_158502 [Lottia gigantea]ESO99414.1 hypothetical protein LOTGIDRAFT_158502 [Lottia gigantea]
MSLEKQINKERQEILMLQSESTHTSTHPTASQLSQQLLSSSTDSDRTEGRRTKACQIYDFIWDDPSYRDDSDDFVSFQKDGSLTVNKKNRPRYDKLSIEQWGYANSKIMERLINDGSLSTTIQIMGYMEYTESVFRLFSRYLKSSVLMFDKEYRELQNKLKFKWGTVRQDLHNFQLIAKTPLSGEASQKKYRDSSYSVNSKEFQSRHRGPTTPTGKEICIKFNSETCDRATCKFQHCCCLCHLEHPAIKHGSTWFINLPRG